MHRPFILPAAVLASALVLGCGDQLDPSEPAKQSPPSFRAEVIRFPFDFVSTTDPNVGLSLTIGIASPLADHPDCGGTGPVITDGKRVVQLVFTAAGSVHQFVRATKATIVLYESTAFDFCDWTTAPVFARGRANLTFNILDKTRDVVGLKIQGIVELTSGGRAHVLNTAQVHVEEDGTVTVHQDRLVVKPIGG
jgi:hypothetical protein